MTECGVQFSRLEVFEERKEGVERETTRHNDADMMAEVCEDKGNDILSSVMEDTSTRIDCMQRRS